MRRDLHIYAAEEENRSSKRRRVDENETRSSNTPAQIDSDSSDTNAADLHKLFQIFPQAREWKTLPEMNNWTYVDLSPLTLTA